jgi:LL-diaminopimelate aminotransferase
MPRFAARLTALPPYPLAHLPARKRALLAAGVDVIDLGAGDADLAPPAEALEAMQRALAEPAMHRYGFGIGHVPFREAIAAYMQERFGVACDPLAEVVPLLGSKEGLAHVASAFLQPGDVAVLPDPAYAAYLGGTLLADAEPHVVRLEARHDFLVELDQLPAEVLARTRVVYLNYPNNPTGAIAPREYLARTVRTCVERDILLVFDNAYAEYGFDGYVPPSIFEIEGAREVAIEFHSLSKTFNMTGWRCGWAVARPELAGALAKVKSFVDTGTFLPIQAAGAAALRARAGFVPGNIATFRERRDAAVAAFAAGGFDVHAPRSTMYLWIPLPGGIASAEFADRLREEAGVIVMPGVGFGAGGEGYFRVSFIQSPARTAEAARRAGDVLAALRATSAAPSADAPSTGAPDAMSAGVGS